MRHNQRIWTFGLLMFGIGANVSAAAVTSSLAWFVAYSTLAAIGMIVAGLLILALDTDTN